MSDTGLVRWSRIATDLKRVGKVLATIIAGIFIGALVFLYLAEATGDINYVSPIVEKVIAAAVVAVYTMVFLKKLSNRYLREDVIPMIREMGGDSCD